MKVTDDTPLQKPTVDLILEAEKLFDEKNEATESALIGCSDSFRKIKSFRSHSRSRQSINSTPPISMLFGS
jgi:hypothetical protein